MTDKEKENLVFEITAYFDMLKRKQRRSCLNARLLSRKEIIKVLESLLLLIKLSREC